MVTATERRSEILVMVLFLFFLNSLCIYKTDLQKDQKKFYWMSLSLDPMYFYIFLTKNEKNSMKQKRLDTSYAKQTLLSVLS